MIKTDGSWLAFVSFPGGLPDAERDAKADAKPKDSSPISGGAQVVCLKFACPGAELEFGCVNSSICPGSDRTYGCDPPIEWQDPGASFIWASGIDLDADDADDAAYWFETSFYFEGDIVNDYIVDLDHTYDDGSWIVIDGKHVTKDLPGSECSIHRLVNVQGDFAAIEAGWHTIEYWGISGECDSFCSYRKNPAGFAMKMTIRPRQ